MQLTIIGPVTVDRCWGCGDGRGLRPVQRVQYLDRQGAVHEQYLCRHCLREQRAALAAATAATGTPNQAALDAVAGV